MAYTFLDVHGGPNTHGRNLGITQFAGVEGDTITVAVLGTSKMLAGGVIPAGAEIEVNPIGIGVAKAAGSTSVTVARALEAAKSGGDIIEVLLIPN
jgi:hypothetical protein